MAKAFKCDSCGSFSTKIPWHITIGKPYHISETTEYELCDHCKLIISTFIRSCEPEEEKRQ